MAKTPKSELLLTAYEDGSASAMAFVADQLLSVAWRVREEKPIALVIDLESSRVSRGKALPVGGDLLHGHESPRGREALPGEGFIQIKQGKKVVKKLERTGKFPRVRWLDEDALFSSRGEVLNRWKVSTGKAQKFKCHDDVTHVASTAALLAACNKEGVISLFDARKLRRLVCVRPALDGSWIAFDDTGAWDASEDFDGRGVELSWSDAKSTAFVPGTGFGWLELNAFPLTRVVASTGAKTPGLLALRTAGRW
ncbi:MAG: hypothetical protein QM817_14975 [Archangium sp.]